MISAKNSKNIFKKPLVWAPLFLSLIFHLVTLIKISEHPKAPPSRNLSSEKTTPVRVRFKPLTPAPESEPKTILRTEQEENNPTPPEDAQYLATTNHQTKNETKVSIKKLVRESFSKSAAKTGKNNPQTPEGMPKLSNKITAELPLSKPAESFKPILKAEGSLEILETPKPEKYNLNSPKAEAGKTPYDQLLAHSLSQMDGEVKKGYQDYLEENLSESETVDINTKEYRFTGYFANMLKAIELVWVYPSHAARIGLEGKVTVRFIILKNGKTTGVSVVNSSGYKILDESILEAIKLAAPFAPLPQGVGKEKLPVQGTFSYILSRY